MTQLFQAAFNRKPKHHEITRALEVATLCSEIMSDLRCTYDRAFSLAFHAEPASHQWRMVRYLIQDHADRGLVTIEGVRRAATLLSRTERKARGEAVAPVKPEAKSNPITFESLFGDAL